MEKEYLNIVSFNLKNDSILTLKNYRFSSRLKLIKALFNVIEFDVMGIQELLFSNKKLIDNILIDYFSIGKGRSNKDDETTIIFFAKKRFKLVKEETFWLSESPTEIGSKNMISLFPRICTMAIVEDLYNNNHKYLFVNTHLDHLFPITRTYQVKKLLELIENFKNEVNASTIIMGDFNTTLKSTALKQLQEEPYKYKGIFSSKSSNTLHYFRGVENEAKDAIDHIFYDEDFQLISHEVINFQIDNSYPSDHFPITAKFKLKR